MEGAENDNLPGACLFNKKQGGLGGGSALPGAFRLDGLIALPSGF